MHDFLQKNRPGCLAIARKCVNDFAFGNETKYCVLTPHYESANILCAEQSAALLMLASRAIVLTLVPFRLKMFSMVIASSHRVVWQTKRNQSRPESTTKANTIGKAGSFNELRACLQQQDSHRRLREYRSQKKTFEQSIEQSRGLTVLLERGLQAGINATWLRRTERTRIGEWRAAIG